MREEAIFSKLINVCDETGTRKIESYNEENAFNEENAKFSATNE